ncbi:hypothetical protein ABW21_db0202548 [Orbilia brochopaga]|nr:hypothetical protein ABW21_db0202548 [Drechslerella brochopaga]
MFADRPAVFASRSAGSWQIEGFHISFGKDGRAPKIFVVLTRPGFAIARYQVATPEALYFRKPWGYWIERGQNILTLESVCGVLHRATDYLGSSDIEAIDFRQELSQDVDTASFLNLGLGVRYRFRLDIQFKYPEDQTRGELEAGLILEAAPNVNQELIPDETYVDALAAIYFKAWISLTNSRGLDLTLGRFFRVDGNAISHQTRSILLSEEMQNLLKLKYDGGGEEAVVKEVVLIVDTNHHIGKVHSPDSTGLLMALGSLECAGIAAMMRNYPNQLGGSFRITSISWTVQGGQLQQLTVDITPGHFYIED